MKMLADDKLAIQELLARAAYGLDVRDLDILTACFAEEAVMTLRIAGADLVGPFDGRVAIMKLMTDSMEQQTDQRRHVTTNIFFESESKDAASLVSNLTLLGTEDGQMRLISAGVYQDEVARQSGEWKLVKRHIELDLPY
ncbi:MAG TPA: nuclear transport factor 2 family protein [Pseudomonadales bacterium]|nr:nuclear transport factor 2 family protein [Gammaproteobacteria bacterium]HIL84870.1 nuclear transport factor 2 family protein [Pseudomonadales bacterium]